MALVPACGLALCLSVLLEPASCGLDWSGRLLAAETGVEQPDERLTNLLIGIGDAGSDIYCNSTADCCNPDDKICECDDNICICYKYTYWQRSTGTCVKQGNIGDNCSRSDEQAGEQPCQLDHSSCQYVPGRGYRCECDYQYYPDTGGRQCVRAQSPFFTTTIIVSICILFAAVAIGVVMQIRSNMQRRLYQQRYRRRADLDQLLAAQRHARQRRAAQRRANPTRRYSEEAEPDEPPPPYVPIFTTRASGDWGKLPSYQEAVAASPQQDNEAFSMEAETPSEGTPSSSVETASPPSTSALSIETETDSAHDGTPSAEVPARPPQSRAPPAYTRVSGAPQTRTPTSDAHEAPRTRASARDAPGQPSEVEGVSARGAPPGGAPGVLPVHRVPSLQPGPGPDGSPFRRTGSV